MTPPLWLWALSVAGALGILALAVYAVREARRLS